MFHLLGIAYISRFFKVKKIKHFSGNIFADQIKAQALDIVDKFVDVPESRFNFCNFQVSTERKKNEHLM